MHRLLPLGIALAFVGSWLGWVPVSVEKFDCGSLYQPKILNTDFGPDFPVELLGKAQSAFEDGRLSDGRHYRGGDRRRRDRRHGVAARGGGPAGDDSVKPGSALRLFGLPLEQEDERPHNLQAPPSAPQGGAWSAHSSQVLKPSSVPGLGDGG